MINSQYNKIALPMYAYGAKKMYQSYSRHANLNLTYTGSYSNSVPVFQTPIVKSDLSVIDMKLYIIDNQFSTALTHAEFITHRASEIDISTLISALSENTINGGKMFFFEGIETISKLDVGIYEMQITLSDNSIIESDLICISDESEAPEVIQVIGMGDGIAIDAGENSLFLVE